MLLQSTNTSSSLIPSMHHRQRTFLSSKQTRQILRNPRMEVFQKEISLNNSHIHSSKLWILITRWESTVQITPTTVMLSQTLIVLNTHKIMWWGKLKAFQNQLSLWIQREVTFLRLSHKLIRQPSLSTELSWETRVTTKCLSKFTTISGTGSKTS